MASGKSDWANLPSLILDIVLENLHEALDRIWFAGVCINWRSVAKEYNARNPYQKHPPMLLIPSKNPRTKRRLYNVFEGKFCDAPLLSVPYNKRCCGSSYGWLAFLDSKKYEVTLLNPFKDGITITLPPLDFKIDTCPDWLKVLLSADPLLSPDNYAAVAIYGGHARLAFLRSCDKMWTLVDRNHTLFTDFVFHKNLVYAVEHYGKIISFDINYRSKACTKKFFSGGDHMHRTVRTKIDFLQLANIKVVWPAYERIYTHRSYLVESSRGVLLLVQRFMDDNDITERFKISKLVLEEETGLLVEMMEIKDMDGDTLFLGDNYSTSIKASDFPECKPNSIYYTDDFIELPVHQERGPRDMGIFHLEDGRIEQHYVFKPSNKHSPPSFWIFLPIY